MKNFRHKEGLSNLPKSHTQSKSCHSGSLVELVLWKLEKLYVFRLSLSYIKDLYWALPRYEFVLEIMCYLKKSSLVRVGDMTFFF